MWKGGKTVRASEGAPVSELAAAFDWNPHRHKAGPEAPNVIRRCPFCDETPLEIEDMGYLKQLGAESCRVRCRCGAQGPAGVGRARAVQAWNWRSIVKEKGDK